MNLKLKRNIDIIVLSAVVFITGAVAMPHSFIFQHEIGLFLWLPDYFRDIFDGTFPISTLIGDFLVQFYKFPLVGALCTTLIVSGIYLIFRGIFRKITRFASLFALLVSLAAWFVIARSTTPVVGVGILLVSALLRVACIPLKSFVRKSGSESHLLPLVAIGIAAIVIISDPVIRSLNLWGRIETAAKQGKWDKVLKAATPERAAKERDMVPFALLAAGSKGQMTLALAKYKVANPGEMDFSGVENRRGFYFESLLYERLGCFNEAVHNIYQCGCHTHRGMSFAVLTQLIRYNIELGDFTLVRKYCRILRHSPAYRATADKLLEMYEGKEDVIIEGGPASSAKAITGNPMVNLVNMEQCGIKSAISRDRYNAYATLLERYRSSIGR